VVERLPRRAPSAVTILSSPTPKILLLARDHRFDCKGLQAVARLMQEVDRRFGPAGLAPAGNPRDLLGMARKLTARGRRGYLPCDRMILQTLSRRSGNGRIVSMAEGNSRYPRAAVRLADRVSGRDSRRAGLIVRKTARYSAPGVSQGSRGDPHGAQADTDAPPHVSTAVRGVSLDLTRETLRRF